MTKKNVDLIHKLGLFMATFNPLQGKKVAYGQIDRFIKKDLSCGPFVVFSVAEVAKDKSEALRVSWNKNAFKSAYNEELVYKTLNTIKKTAPSSEKWHLIKDNSKNYIFIELGLESAQAYYCFFELGSSIADSCLELLITFIHNIHKSWKELDELKKIEDLVHIDDVTGLFNQRKLLKDIDQALERFEKINEEFSVLFIDIDHFKSVNDGHGHLVGTHLLAKLGTLLQKTLRESDLIYRYGGDEFVMLIPDVGPKVAQSIGDRVLKAVSNEDFLLEGSLNSKEETSFKLSVSIGVASFPSDAKSKEEILLIADRMMYEAKKSGRGKVCHTHEIFNKAN